MEPWKPPSSSPTAWSSVDLPDPDGPSSATISPGATSRSTPRNTSIVTSPWVKLRLRPLVTRTGSLIAQDLHWVGACSPVGGIKRREERQHQRGQHDRGHLDRIGLRRQIGEKANRRIPEVLPRQLLDCIDDPLTEEEEDRSEDDPEHDSERADRHA